MTFDRKRIQKMSLKCTTQADFRAYYGKKPQGPLPTQDSVQSCELTPNQSKVCIGLGPFVRTVSSNILGCKERRQAVIVTSPYPAFPFCEKNGDCLQSAILIHLLTLGLLEQATASFPSVLPYMRPFRLKGQNFAIA